MIIAGLDVSTVSTGCVKFYLDSAFNIVDVKKLGFCHVSNSSSATYEDIIMYKDFSSFYHRQDFMLNYIMDFLNDVEYVALEDYAFGAKGKITMLAEICGNIKSRLFSKNVSLRLYDPTSIKIFATGKGNAKKPDMNDSYDNLTYKINLNYLPIIPTHKKGKNKGLRNKDGISPLSDIIDAFFICDLLRYELGVKNKVFDLASLNGNCSRILNRTTKTTKTCWINQTFICL